MRIYYTGLILIILSWLICLNPYGLVYAVPFLILGILLVWFSKTSLKSKLFTTILPILLWFPGMLLYLYLVSKKMTPETFLVPKNFRGKITLIYNEPCGETLEKIDGRLIYKIPNNGVMILTNVLETGTIDHEYYLFDEKWNKIEKIPLLIQQDFNEDYTLERNENEPPRNKVGMFLLGTGGGNDLEKGFYSFHIMAVNSWDSLRTGNYEKFHDKLVDSLLTQCREKKGNNF